MKWNRPEKEKPLPPTGYVWRFPFGVYAGKTVYDVPLTYLAEQRHKSRNMVFCERCTNEIERRKRIASAVKLNQ
jgi:hypothetical protein